MPVANVIDLVGITAGNMDLYERQYLRTVNDPPPGLLVYLVGALGETIRVIEVWDSDEARDAFYRDRVNSATDAYLADGHPSLTDEVEMPMSVRLFWSAGQAEIGPPDS